MGVDISVDFGSVVGKLPIFSLFITDRVLNALDECAGLVANDAKEGHPKVNYLSTEGASYLGINRNQWRMAADDAFRIANKDGSLRFLTRTGNLRNSILPTKAVRTKDGMESHVISGMSYSTKVEYGDGKARAFPFMRPALDKNFQEIQNRVAAAVRGGIDDGGAAGSSGGGGSPVSGGGGGFGFGDAASAFLNRLGSDLSGGIEFLEEGGAAAAEIL